MKSLYFALIHYRLQCGIYCWGSMVKHLADKLRIIQNQFLKLFLFRRQNQNSIPLFRLN